MNPIQLCASCFASLEKRRVFDWPSERRARLAIQTTMQKCLECRAQVPRLRMLAAISSLRVHTGT